MATPFSILDWRSPIDKRWAMVHRVAKSQTQPKQLHMHVLDVQGYLTCVVKLLYNVTPPHTSL